MAICPHCQAQSPNLLDPCPNGAAYYCIDEKDFASHREDKLLGRAISERFVILTVLGQGSMGKVYRAQQVQVDRTVALKVFHAQELVDRAQDTGRNEALEVAELRFAQEARVLGRLAHPNCVTLYDFGVDDQQKLLYIAMEYVAGLSLRRAISRGLTFPMIKEVTQQVLLALREAHAMDIVHRDLKPENIILSFRFASEEPVVKVVDFGIAKLLGSDIQNQTSVGSLFGTPAYMSPEQCRGDIHGVGPHSDIYSFGCIAFEMVTGQLPFPGRYPQEVVRMHLELPTPPIIPLESDIPGAFLEFIRKAMAKDPADRFADGREALIAFSKLMDSDTNMLSTSESMLKRASLTSAKSSKVVVPRDQISGEFPVAQLEPVADPGVRTHSPIRQRSADGDGSFDGLPTPAPRPRKAGASDGPSLGLWLGIFGFLLLVCILVVWYVYQTTR